MEDGNKNPNNFSDKKSKLSPKIIGLGMVGIIILLIIISILIRESRKKNIDKDTPSKIESSSSLKNRVNPSLEVAPNTSNIPGNTTTNTNENTFLTNNPSGSENIPKGAPEENYPVPPEVKTTITPPPVNSNSQEKTSLTTRGETAPVPPEVTDQKALDYAKQINSGATGENNYPNPTK